MVLQLRETRALTLAEMAGYVEPVCELVDLGMNILSGLDIVVTEEPGKLTVYALHRLPTSRSDGLVDPRLIGREAVLRKIPRKVEPWQIAYTGTCSVGRHAKYGMPNGYLALHLRLSETEEHKRKWHSENRTEQIRAQGRVFWDRKTIGNCLIERIDSIIIAGYGAGIKELLD